MHRSVSPVCSLLLTLALLSCAAAAETITLHDGRSFTGTVHVGDETVTVNTGDQLFQFARNQVKLPPAKQQQQQQQQPADAATAPAYQGKKRVMSNPVIKIETSKGDITCELFEDKVPNTTANIINLAEAGFYDDMSFHRVITGFMAQGGCPHSKAGASGSPGTGGPGYRFADEIHPQLKHDRPGILSMANAGPNTNGSQFFLCFVATPWLDGKHAVFGQVIDGLDVLKELEKIGSSRGTTSEKVTFSIRVVEKQEHEYKVQKLK